VLNIFAHAGHAPQMTMRLDARMFAFVPSSTFAQIFYALAPRAYEIVMNTAFRLFPDSTAAKGMTGRQEVAAPTTEQIAFASLMRGVHW
jgi:hypothetical protein